MITLCLQRVIVFLNICIISCQVNNKSGMELLLIKSMYYPACLGEKPHFKLIPVFMGIDR